MKATQEQVDDFLRKMHKEGIFELRKDGKYLLGEKFNSIFADELVKLLKDKKNQRRKFERVFKEAITIVLIKLSETALCTNEIALEMSMVEVFFKPAKKFYEMTTKNFLKQGGSLVMNLWNTEIKGVTQWEKKYQ